MEVAEQFDRPMRGEPPHAAVDSQCSAKSKRTGNRCSQPVVIGSRTCHYHSGGHELYGAANPSFKTGRYSKILALKPSLASSYEATLNDPAYASLKNQIAVLDARGDEILTELAGAGNSTTWVNVALDLLNGYRVATQTDAEQAALALNKLQELLEGGVKTEHLWTQLGENYEQRRKLVDTEGKNAERASRMINAEQARTLVLSLIGVIQEELAPLGPQAAKIAGALSRRLVLLWSGNDTDPRVKRKALAEQAEKQSAAEAIEAKSTRGEE